MAAYYNEINAHHAQWLRNLIADGHIAPGVVDERSIEDVRPDDLVGFTQCHFFAGVGGWSIALRMAGWPDNRPAWSGSCPCQPFSQTGEGLGFADERHLWPGFHWLIQERKPTVVFGEQVAGKDTDPWIDLVCADMEGLGYAFGAVPLPAAGVGSPQLRDRLYWVANATRLRLGQEHPDAGGSAQGGGPQRLTPGPMPSRAFEWRIGLDGRRRPLEPGVEPVVAGFPGLLEQLGAYGNAINVTAARVFIESVMG
ncbi:MAG: DNA cytosine methyltransferase [Xanthomonadaceae bacterium]|nr:DNA cytosine methyltransferase [Xanthomonadaceae bacterium]